ncbi:hypothetical protein H920_00765 [Fukomys damarensis]|uniref:Uncharacterized protein n=1 Tax=Fukomys damarensis TaxID=885580 RepID=A0A091EQ35_FUKDA|nr:hypothetical protein H920_00765 [Fukomys damarensis]
MLNPLYEHYPSVTADLIAETDTNRATFSCFLERFVIRKTAMNGEDKGCRWSWVGVGNQVQGGSPGSKETEILQENRLRTVGFWDDAEAGVGKAWRRSM